MPKLQKLIYYSICFWSIATLLLVLPLSVEGYIDFYFYLNPILNFTICLLLARLLIFKNKTQHLSSLIYVGLLVISGSFFFDVYATLTQSPTLDNEGNFIIVHLLNHSYSLEAVKQYIITTQTLSACMMIGFWALFCFSINQITDELESSSLIKLIPKLIGGKEATFKRLLLSKLDPVYFNAFIGLMAVSLCLIKLFCVLEWYDIVPTYIIYYPATIIMVMTILAYGLWMKALINKRVRLKGASFSVKSDYVIPPVTQN